MRGSLLAMAGAVALLVANGAWFRGSYQEDGPVHFVQAREAWRQPANLVDVWGRPLYTLIYSLPAQAGYEAARWLSLAVLCASMFLVIRAARLLNLPGAEWAWVFLVSQPTVIQLSMDTMTEPLFGLAWLGAYLLHLERRPRWSLLVAGALPLIRPEGFLVAAAWPLVVGWRRPDRLLVLAGVGAWWLTALWITGDPLHLVRNWPAGWQGASPYGRGHPLTFLAWAPLILGPIALVPFVLSCARRLLVLPLVFVACFFTFHSVAWAVGVAGSAGYPRYFVSVGPFLALLAAAGVPAGWRSTGSWSAGVATVGVLLALPTGFVFQECHRHALDPRGLDGLAVEEPFASSRAYLLARRGQVPVDPMQAKVVVWDEEVGPKLHGLRVEGFRQAGFEVETRRIGLPRSPLARWIAGEGVLTVHLLRKPR